MTPEDRADALRVCDEAHPAPWGGEGFRIAGCAPIPTSDEIIANLLKDKERLAKDAAAYRKLLEAGRAWLGTTTSGVCGSYEHCGTPACVLANLIQNATPCQAPECDGEREGADIGPASKWA